MLSDSDDLDQAEDEQLFPMASWGLRRRKTSARDLAEDEAMSPIEDVDDVSEEYFGSLTVCQTMTYGFPNLGWYSMKFMLSSFVKIFYTDDYPRVNLAGIGLVAALQILIDIIFDPLIATWTDNLRGGLCGCFPYCGRRKPFLILSGILGVIASAGLWAPPMGLSGTPPAADLPGKHSYWRIIDETHLHNWGVREVDFYDQVNTLSSSLVLGGVPLTYRINSSTEGSSTFAFDGNDTTWALGSGAANGSIGKNWSASGPVEILALRVLQFKTGSSVANVSSRGSVQYSDDGLHWVTAYSISPALNTKGTWGVASVHFNSMASLLWYAVFIILFKVVVTTLREVPYEALPAEMTPDSDNRSALWAQWAIWQTIGILLGAVLPSFSYFGPDCTGTALDGCYNYIFLAIVLSLVHLLSILCSSTVLKERKAQLLPPPESGSIIVMLVQTWLNRPFRVLLVSDILEGFGAEVPFAVLPFMVKWVLGEQIIRRQVGVSNSMFFALCAGLHLVSKVAFTFVWRCIVRRFGKFRSFVAYNVLSIIQYIAFVFFGKSTGCYYVFAMMITWAFASSGFWILRSMMADVIDYDDFLCGQRREAQYMMLASLLPKFAEVPGVTLPFFFMAKFGYNPTLEPSEMPAGVIWTLKLSMSVVPAIAMLLGLFILFRYPIRSQEQIDELQKGLEKHHNKLPAQDPLCEGSIVQPTFFHHDAGEIHIGGRTISNESSEILQHFFPGELQSVLEGHDFSVIHRKQLCSMVFAILLLPVGIVAMVLGWADLGSKVGASITPIGLMLAGFALYILCFNGVRMCKAREASRACSMEDVETQLAMYEPFERLQHVAACCQKDKVEDESEDDEDDDDE